MHQMAVRNWIKEIRSHALWDAIKWISLVIAPLLYAALRALHIAPDVVGVFAVSALVGTITWLIASRHKEPQRATAWASLDKFLRRTVEVREVRLSLGEFQEVTSAYDIHSLRIEVMEIAPDKALTAIGARSVLFVAATFRRPYLFQESSGFHVTGLVKVINLFSTG